MKAGEKLSKPEVQRETQRVDIIRCNNEKVVDPTFVNESLVDVRPYQTSSKRMKVVPTMEYSVT